MTTIETTDIECLEDRICSEVYAQTLAGEKLLESINDHVNGLASPEKVEAAMAAFVAAAVKTRDARRRYFQSSRNGNVAR